jgi:hypothetical protein
MNDVSSPRELPDKDRPSPSVRSLNQWLRDAERQTGLSQQWLGWQLASTVVIAALQRATGADAVPLFLVKGGVYVEMQLGGKAQTRATKDIDTLFRGTVEEFTATLRQVMTKPWGPFTMETTDIEQIAGAKRLIKPCRFDVRLNVKGATISLGSTWTTRWPRNSTPALTPTTKTGSTTGFGTSSTSTSSTNTFIAESRPRA